jgi:hypothetical protein
MKVSQYLASIAQVAREQQSCVGDDVPHFKTTLSDLALRLRNVAQSLPGKLKAACELRAGWAEAYSKTEGMGSITFWSEMCAIEELANRCLGHIRPKKVPDLTDRFAQKVQEFYLGLFMFLQFDGLIAEDQKPIKMKGEIEAVTEFYGDQIQGLISQLSQEDYPAILVLWKQFLKVNATDPERSFEILNSLVALVSEGSDDERTQEITPEQFAAVKVAIHQGDLRVLKEQMLSLFMDTLEIELRVELVKLAIDQPNPAVLECLADCDWFSDMNLSAFKEVIAYAEGKEKHLGIIKGTTGYVIESSFATEGKGA